MKLDILEQVIADKAERRPVIVATDMMSGDQQLVYPTTTADLGRAKDDADAVFNSGKSATVEIDDRQMFLHVHNPARRLIIVGAVHIAQMLVPMAILAGYDTTIIDPRQAFATEERFPGVTLVTEWPDEVMEASDLDHWTAVVVLTHDPKIDEPALKIALESDCFYVGALGSKKTHAKRCERLKSAGFSNDQIEKIHGPIGLDIGGIGPAEIAVSIIAEITAASRGKLEG